MYIFYISFGGMLILDLLMLPICLWMIPITAHVESDGNINFLVACLQCIIERFRQAIVLIVPIMNALGHLPSTHSICVERVSITAVSRKHNNVSRYWSTAISTYKWCHRPLQKASTLYKIKLKYRFQTKTAYSYILQIYRLADTVYLLAM